MSLSRSFLALVSTTAASVVASVALPSAVITLYALGTRDTEAITRFALAVAEPLALLGAGGATALLARRVGRWTGVAAAAGILGAALWVNDVDAWTYAALAGLPVVGWLAARGRPRSTRRGTGETTAVPGPTVTALPGEGVPEPVAPAPQVAPVSGPRAR